MPPEPPLSEKPIHCSHCLPEALFKSSRKIKKIVITAGRIIRDNRGGEELRPQGRCLRFGAWSTKGLFMNSARRILIVEDDEHIADLLQLHLRDEGYAITHAADGDEGARLLEQGHWDAIVLDIMLPGVDGLEICKRARTMDRYVPIIITSARSSEVHRILGLELGADDYLAKPFSVLELVARVKALLRRTEALARNARAEAGALVADGLAIDPVSRSVTLDGKPLELTPREFDLLYFFARHPNRVFSRLELLNEVWGYQHDGYEHTVNTHINRLRTKIEIDPSSPQRILTAWGHGYKFAAPGG
jgi:DNA-binding response OmpR family regulator